MQKSLQEGRRGMPGSFAIRSSCHLQGLYRELWIGKSLLMRLGQPEGLGGRFRRERSTEQ